MTWAVVAPGLGVCTEKGRLHIYDSREAATYVSNIGKAYGVDCKVVEVLITPVRPTKRRKK